MRELTIGSTRISDDTLPFVIAEIGHNHQGNLDTALRLIRSAAASGASAVKFQKRDNQNLYTSEFFNSPYNSENSFGKTYGLHREALEFNVDEYKKCIDEAERCGILFFATAFDFQSANFLAELDVPAFKIASGDLKSIPLIKHIASIKKPIILSTGGATSDDVDRAVLALEQENADYAILQCTAGYPPKWDEINLRVIETFRSRYPETVIGYSGHDSGIQTSIAAYLLGARIIEKHFTLDRTMKGTDHAFSLEPSGMQKLTRDLKILSFALGDGIKRAYESEFAPIRKMGKMIVANKNLHVGQTLSLEDVDLKSPGDGLSPDYLDQILGNCLTLNVSKGDPLRMEHFQ